MSDLNVCKKSKANPENVITCKGRISWNKIAEPNEKGNFELSMVFPPESDMTVLKAAVKEVLDKNQTAEQQKKTKYNSPIRKTEDYPSLSDYAEDFPIIVSANTKFQPGVVTASGQDVANADFAEEIYSGRWARMSVSASYYPPIDGGKPGVKFYLQNIQLLDHDDRIGGSGGRVKASSEFEGVGSDADNLFE